MEVYYSAARTVIAGRLPEVLQFISAIFLLAYRTAVIHMHIFYRLPVLTKALGLKAYQSTAIHKYTYSLALCPAEIRRHSLLMASCGNSEAFLQLPVPALQLFLLVPYMHRLAATRGVFDPTVSLPG